MRGHNNLALTKTPDLDEARGDEAVSRTPRSDAAIAAGHSVTVPGRRRTPRKVGSLARDPLPGARSTADT
eukprot:CAMPEP_0185714264 /NCGR_PEP_ID=MMETSP1164-20130828/38414_1 /TAXON_ID=1104430 /ORGANISM="Chrysoreinhardia sp, Strain CCMP2950" /LENGTH=69 /DNA_ID=CAMNT_0028381845 /DNA_START=92 /DNA_END=304 /DNA_ORIENTATION=+